MTTKDNEGNDTQIPKLCHQAESEQKIENCDLQREWNQRPIERALAMAGGDIPGHRLPARVEGA
jgi:hypothetical protein